jgi:hypothetical protein
MKRGQSDLRRVVPWENDEPEAKPSSEKMFQKNNKRCVSVRTISRSGSGYAGIHERTKHPSWQVVRSDDGDFAVPMPAKPTFGR